MIKNAFWHCVSVVLKKELKDAVRDKRAIRLAFLPSLYFVGMFTVGVLFAIHLQKDNEVNGVVNVPVHVSGVEHWPELAQWLEEQGAQLKPINGDAHQLVEEKKINFALIIPSEARGQRDLSKAATLWLVYDASNPKVHSSLGFVRAQIQAWSARESSIQLLARGINPDLRSAITLRETNIASDQKMGTYILGSLPMLLLISAFIGSVGFSADMTAGERERRSLESLLITPSSSMALMVGKWCASMLLTLTVLLVTMILLGIALNFLPFVQLGLRVEVGIVDLTNVFLCLVPVACYAVALQLLVAIFARSFKDAQTYVGLLVFIPLIPSLYNMLNPGVSKTWFSWVPILGQQVLIKDLFVGGELSIGTLAIFWCVAITLWLLFLPLAAKQLRRPKIVYG